MPIDRKRKDRKIERYSKTYQPTKQMLSIETNSVSGSSESGPRLKMMFERGGDRWAHRVVSVSEDTETIVLQSIEGDDQTQWPPSPPLQDPDQHDLPTGAAVLAVGMAGTGHWSASFSVDRADFLLADVACFCKARPPETAAALVSTYQIAAGVEIVHNTPSAVELLHENGRLRIEAVSGADWGSEIQVSDSNQLKVIAERLNRDSKKSTRWSYRLKCLPDS
jgi:hypothetical protein